MAKLALFGGPKVRKKPFVSGALIGKEERLRVKSVLDSGMLSGFIARAGASFLGGKQVKDLESEVKDYFGCKHVVAVNSATAGLHVALAACGIGPGDEVIVPPYTMSASATAILMVNAVPVFVDIEERTFGLDPVKVEKAVTRRTKAIVIVHLFGHPARIGQIMKIAKKHNLKVIEDCAQSPGAMVRQKLVGLFGNVGVFSLNQHKTITCGEGGFCLSNNDDIALRMRLVRNHGEVIAEDMNVKQVDNIVGYNYRMTELEAAVSVGQFRRLDQLNDYRIDLARYLAFSLKSFPGLIMPIEEKGCKHVYFTFPVRWLEQKTGITRDVAVKALQAEGIPVGAGYVRPIYLEPAYRRKIAHGNKGCPFSCSYYKGRVSYVKGCCPVTERMHEKELLVTPICRYPHTKKDINDLVSAFEKIYENMAELR